MGVELNHIIIWTGDKWASAEFLARVLGIQAGPQWGEFVAVRTSNGVTIDYPEAADIGHQHCAFLVSDTELDVALARIQSAGIEFYADYDRKGRGEINQLYGGRGFTSTTRTATRLNSSLAPTAIRLKSGARWWSATD
jgi:hypothetical protein